MENSLDVRQLWNYFKENKWILVISTCTCLFTMILYLYFFSPPVYKSEAEVIINQATSVKNPADAQTVQANLQLVSTYTSIMKSQRILTQISKTMNNKYSVHELRQMVTISSPADSQIIHVNVEGTNAKDVVKIANETIIAFSKTIPQIMKINNVYTLSPAVYTPEMAPIKPHKILMLIFSVAFGCTLGLIIMFVRSLLDTTIKTPQDVEQHLGLVVLASINQIEMKNPATSKRK